MYSICEEDKRKHELVKERYGKYKKKDPTSRDEKYAG